MIYTGISNACMLHTLYVNNNSHCELIYFQKLMYMYFLANTKFASQFVDGYKHKLEQNKLPARVDQCQRN